MGYARIVCWIKMTLLVKERGFFFFFKLTFHWGNNNLRDVNLRINTSHLQSIITLAQIKRKYFHLFIINHKSNQKIQMRIHENLILASRGCRAKTTGQNFNYFSRIFGIQIFIAIFGFILKNAFNEYNQAYYWPSGSWHSTFNFENIVPNFNFFLHKSVASI